MNEVQQVKESGRTTIFNDGELRDLAEIAEWLLSIQSALDNPNTPVEELKNLAGGEKAKSRLGLLKELETAAKNEGTEHDRDNVEKLLDLVDQLSERMADDGIDTEFTELALDAALPDDQRDDE